MIDSNSKKVKSIEQHAQNNISLTLDGVMDFLNSHHGELTTQYKVFQSLCLVLVGHKEKVKNKTYYSRVDIELINEQVKLFYSNLDEVEIRYSDDICVTEYIAPWMGWRI